MHRMETKTTLRPKLKLIRQSLADRTPRSQVIFQRLNELDFYHLSSSIALYASFRSEVETYEEISRRVQVRCQVTLPKCFGDELRLFHIQSLDELQAGAFGIPEPVDRVVQDSQRSVRPDSVQLFVVPGIGFDRQGNRLGHGKGHYDRLLAQASEDAIKVAVCFDCQLLEQLPSEPHDIRMDWVVTESDVICTSE